MSFAVWETSASVLEAHSKSAASKHGVSKYNRVAAGELEHCSLPGGISYQLSLPAIGNAGTFFVKPSNIEPIDYWVKPRKSLW